MRQPEIAARLHLSQARVSRLLRAAQDLGIVRVTIVSPPGLHGDLEDELELRYGLLDAHVVDVSETDDEDRYAAELGRLAAEYLQASLFNLGTVAFLSWSRPLMAMVRWLEPTPRPAATYVVEMLGSLQDPAVQLQVSQTTQRFAEITGGEAIFLPTPGVVASAEMREVMLEHNPFATRALQMHDGIDVAYVGIGTVPLSELLRRRMVLLSAEEVRTLERAGAVGNINLHFYDIDGRIVASPLDGRVIGMRLEQLASVQRSTAVAGGPAKFEAIRGALMGGWARALITDTVTAEALLEMAPPAVPIRPTVEPPSYGDEVSP
jgi:DNA-binding transcriptional regulator LsrR (DeoR family)